MSSQLKPFVLLAKCTWKSEDLLKEDLKGLEEVAEFEHKADPCGSYATMVPLEKGEETTGTVFEAYDNIDYLKNDHRNSEPFKKLQDNVAKLDTRSGPPELSFFTSKGGFLGRDETPSLPLGDQFIWLAKLKAHPGKRDEMIKAALIHADNVKRTEDETLSFVVLESTEDDVSIVLFERYTSEKYFKDVHAVSETMQEYRGKIGSLLADRDSAGYQVVAGFLNKKEAMA